MTPVPEWRRILLRAWSSRIMLAGGLCSAAATAVSLVDGQAIGHPALMPALSLAFNIGALIARVVPQKGLSDGNQPS
jgi:hypothetical protein